MKRIICIIILTVGLIFIGGVTAYTLNHKEVKNKVADEVTKNIENVTSNLSGNNLQEIYNVYMEKEKHKLKLVYYVTMAPEEDKADIKLTVYFDGVSIINENVASNIEGEEIEDIIKDIDFVNYVKIKESDILIKDFDHKEYIMLDVGYYDDNYKEKYYIFNSKGELLIADGLLVLDDSVYYVSDDEEELEIFYDEDKQIYTKIDGDNIYTLVPKEKEDTINIKEYRYKVSDGKAEKELLNTFLVKEKEKDLQVSQINE